MMEIGKIENLSVARIVSPGAILADEEGNEVLLPGKYIPEGLKPDDFIEVFLYTDSEDRIVATTKLPIVMTGDIACLEVVDVTSFGAFVDWGLDKDLLISIKNQSQKLSVGDKCIVSPYYDKYSNRMCGTTKLGFLINNEEITVQENQNVEIMIYSVSPLGYTVIVDKKHWGLVFKNEVFQPVNTGDVLQGFVKKIRPDNKLDITLYKVGREQVDVVYEQLLETLKNNKFLPLSDSSTPEEIYETLKVSKRNFKKAVGKLYKEQKIRFTDKGIELV